MLTGIVWSLMLPAIGATSLNATAAQAFQEDPAVRVWLNKEDVRLGDRVRAYAETQGDGYLLVLHVEPDGRVRVLFPLDPLDDNYVRGGQKYELRGRGDREAFRVYTESGLGTIYAAYSSDPFNFQAFARGDHWDYQRSDVWFVAEDPEGELNEFVAGMVQGAFFDYDVVQYEAFDVTTYARRHRHLTLYSAYYDDYWSDVSFGFYFGPSYRWRWYGFGWVPTWYNRYWYDPWYWHDPFYYSWYDPWYYGSYWGGYYGGYRGGYYAGNYPRYYGNRTVVVVNNDPGLRFRPRVNASNGDNRSRRVFAGGQTAAGRRLSPASQTAPATRRVAVSDRTGVNRRVADRTTPNTRTTETARRALPSATERTAASPRTQPAVRPTATERRQPVARPATTSTRRPQGSQAEATVTPMRQTPQARPSTTRRTTPTSQATTTRGAEPQRSPVARPSLVRRSGTTAQAERRITPRTSTSATERARISAPTRQTSQPSRATIRSAPTVRRPTSSPSVQRSTAPVRRSTPSVRSAPSVQRSAPQVSRPSSPAPRKPATSSSSSSRRRKP